MPKVTVQEYRNALDALELAIIDLGIPDLVEGWGEPRHRPELGVKPTTNAGAVYRLYDAWKVANEIINRDET
ncbi:hypothetical protein [uncultured Roseobacter sp.]|uniref:hypothetical protein n=1 Tax=uncultured Roseobacter sp. TaxID=114847 RepID=UPI002609E19E|nr:hypothetical protein [uncultured Roseobacter sp.]